VIRLLYHWLKTNWTMLLNAGSLVGTTAVTGVFGFAYWWVAARLFQPEAVGLASAAVSAMTLLGTFCILGLGTLLIGELARQPGKELSLISAALILVGGVGVVSGIFFALVAPLVSDGFQAFGANPGVIVLFAAGVGLTAITIVLDEALIGLLKGVIQLGRNALFAGAKLVFLILAGFWLLKVGGQIIYGAWVAGSLLSLLPLAGFVALKSRRRSRVLQPDWQLLRRLKLLALQHHMLNLIVQAPTMAMPVLVTIVLSATTNAWFYIAWMISGLVFIASYALTTVLYAINAGQTAELTRKLRMTLGLSLVTVILSNCVLQLAAGQVLDLFGHMYALQAILCLRILGLAAFPMIIKYHYIAVSRIHSKMARAALPVAIGSLLELGIAALGAQFAGLAGFSLGWFTAVCIEAVFMFPAVYQATFPAKTSDILCPQCNVMLPAYAHFCGACGLKLGGTKLEEQDISVAVAVTRKLSRVWLEEQDISVAGADTEKLYRVKPDRNAAAGRTFHSGEVSHA
jgi:O-antigen/teichoic acid export membrane protein